jgi:hypothetical protein
MPEQPRYTSPPVSLQLIPHGRQPTAANAQAQEGADAQSVGSGWQDWPTWPPVAPGVYV